MSRSGYYMSIEPLVYIEATGIWQNLLVGAVGSVVGAAVTGYISYKLLKYSNQEQIKKEDAKAKNLKKEDELSKFFQISNIIHQLSVHASSINNSIHLSIKEYIEERNCDVDYSVAIKPLIGHKPILDMPKTEDLGIFQRLKCPEMITELSAIITNYNIIAECVNKYNILHEDFQQKIMLASVRDPATGVAMASYFGDYGIELELKHDSINNFMEKIIYDLRDSLIAIFKFAIKLNSKGIEYFSDDLNLLLSTKLDLYEDNFQYLK